MRSLVLLLAEPGSPAPLGGMMDMIVMLGGVFLIMYFLVIRPQRRQEQKRLEMLAAIRKNDRVLTSGGIYGIVTNLKDDEVTLRIDDEKNVRIRVTRQAVTNVLRDEVESS